MRNVLLLISLIFNGYLGYKLWTMEPVVKYISDAHEDTVQVKASAFKERGKSVEEKIKKEMPSKIAKKERERKVEEETVQAPEEKELLIQEKYDSLQREFHKAFENFTYEELRLSESQVLFYHDLRAERQKEIEDHLTPKWEELKKKGEDSSYYVYSSEDLIFLGKLNAKYLQALKREWGRDAFERYQSFLSDYNNTQISNGSDIKFMIDF